MAAPKIRHLVCVKGTFYFRPTPAMRAMGFVSESLGKAEGQARFRAEQLNRDWDEARKQAQEPKVERVKNGTVQWLIEEFQRDRTWYHAKHPRTREQIDHAFKIIGQIFEDVPVRLVRRKHIRSYYNQLREKASVAKAHRIMKWFIRLLNYAVEIEALEYNPAAKFERQSPEPRKEVWTTDELNTVIVKALNPEKAKSGNLIQPRPSVALAIVIAYETSLPQQDILALTWKQYDGEGLSVTQKKKRGNRDLWIPLPSYLRAKLDTMDRHESGFILISEETGRRYEGRLDFGRQFRKTRNRADIWGKTFHDIRRTALTELGNRGATNVELSAFGGHALNSPIQAVYVRPDKEAARRAFKKRRGQE